jgi:hypothetical protein
MSLRVSAVTTISASTGLERSGSAVFEASVPVGALISSLNSRMARPAPLPIPATCVPPNSGSATTSRMTHACRSGDRRQRSHSDSFSENGPLGPSIMIKTPQFHPLLFESKSDEQLPKKIGPEWKARAVRLQRSRYEATGQTATSAPRARTRAVQLEESRATEALDASSSRGKRQSHARHPLPLWRV